MSRVNLRDSLITPYLCSLPLPAFWVNVCMDTHSKIKRQAQYAPVQARHNAPVALFFAKFKVMLPRLLSSPLAAVHLCEGQGTRRRKEGIDALNVHWNIPAIISADDDLALEVEDKNSRRHHCGARADAI